MLMMRSVKMMMMMIRAAAAAALVLIHLDHLFSFKGEKGGKKNSTEKLQCWRVRGGKDVFAAALW